MRTVSRYLLVEFLSASAAVFGVLLITWMAADSLLHLDSFGEDGATAMREVVLRALDLIGLGIPLACLAGVVWSLTRAKRHREITAIRCGGIPLRRALLPLLLAAACIALGIGVFEDRVLIPARLALTQDVAEDETAEIRPAWILDRWWYADGASIFSAGSYDAESRQLQDVSVFRFDEMRRISERIDALSAAHVEGTTWEFRSATIRRFDGAGGLELRTAKTLRETLGVSAADLERAGPPPRATTLRKLARSIRTHVGDPLVRASLQATFHARLAQPFAVLILVMLAIPLAIGDAERGDSLPRALLSSIACAGAYWILYTASMLVGRSGLVPAFLPIWFVTLAGLGIAYARFRTVEQ